MHKNKKHRFLKKVLLGIAGLIIIIVLIGTLTWIPVIEVEQISRHATLEQLWKLWDFDQRNAWDASLEWVKADGIFGPGQTGLLKLKEQPPRRFKITEFDVNRRYTDRFYLPLGGKMDWRHTLEKTEDGVKITWKVTVNGPGALLLFPIMSMILKEELPATVTQFIARAETQE